MRKTVSLLMGAVLLSATPAWSKPAADGSAALARALDGRVAGEPVDCIRLRSIRGSRIIARTGILYEGIDGTIYLNRPDSGAESLGRNDVLVSDVHSGELCDIDVVRLFDPALRTRTGVVFLGKFEPYRKAERAHH
jgi:hypothetical protein